MATNRLTSLAPILAAALIFVVLVNGQGGESATPATSTGPAQVAVPPEAPTALATPARRFLRAFLAYEAGDRLPRTVAALDATATGSFARELAAAKPTGTRHSPATAKLGALTLDPLGGHPPMGLVTATASRPSGPEQLSFLFTERGGRWLASAPGE